MSWEFNRESERTFSTRKFNQFELTAVDGVIEFIHLPPPQLVSSSRFYFSPFIPLQFTRNSKLKSRLPFSFSSIQFPSFDLTVKAFNECRKNSSENFRELFVELSDKRA